MLQMTPYEIGIATKIENKMKSMEQIKNFGTLHSLYEGVYTRTVVLNKGEALAGALIKIPTTLILFGKMKVYIGSNVVSVDGVETIIASANRKQIMYALENSAITMLFKTDAKDIDEAEMEFTDDYDKLVSRQEESINIVKMKEI